MDRLLAASAPAAMAWGDEIDDGNRADRWPEEAPVLAGIAARRCKAAWRWCAGLAPACAALPELLAFAPSRLGPCDARRNGFHFHAGGVVPPRNRGWLERLCRYAPEVSVRSSTGTPRRYVVSSGGGDQPVWRRDGAELFFAGPEGHLFAVPVSPGPNAGLSFGAATKLNVPPMGQLHRGTTYDVSLDGRSIYFEHQTDQKPPREFGVVLGWRALIK